MIIISNKHLIAILLYKFQLLLNMDEYTRDKISFNL